MKLMISMVEVNLSEASIMLGKEREWTLRDVDVELYWRGSSTLPSTDYPNFSMSITSMHQIQNNSRIDGVFLG